MAQLLGHEGSQRAFAREDKKCCCRLPGHCAVWDGTLCAGKLQPRTTIMPEEPLQTSSVLETIALGRWLQYRGQEYTYIYICRVYTYMYIYMQSIYIYMQIIYKYI